MPLLVVRQHLLLCCGSSPPHVLLRILSHLLPMNIFLQRHSGRVEADFALDVDYGVEEAVSVEGAGAPQVESAIRQLIKHGTLLPKSA
jgi:hypothetical protein